MANLLWPIPHYVIVSMHIIHEQVCCFKLMTISALCLIGHVRVTRVANFPSFPFSHHYGNVMSLDMLVWNHTLERFYIFFFYVTLLKKQFQLLKV